MDGSFGRVKFKTIKQRDDFSKQGHRDTTTDWRSQLMVKRFPETSVDSLNSLLSFR